MILVCECAMCDVCMCDGDNPHIASLMVYLADVVTGAVVYQTSHRHACGPVNIVLSENWVVVSGPGFVCHHTQKDTVSAPLQYTYFNVKSRRVEVAVMEMYDTRNQTE